MGGECLTSPGQLGIDGQAGTDGLADWQTGRLQEGSNAFKATKCIDWVGWIC